MWLEGEFCNNFNLIPQSFSPFFFLTTNVVSLIMQSNREGDLISIDCQVRNKSNIHEGISAMCEEELMDGENKVGCDRCNKKTNTVLRTAVSKLSDVLVLSLKRFDLDYNTFETVKINSRYEFEETLNMKQYTLEAKELLEAAQPQERKSETGSAMDLGESDAGNEEDLDPLAALPDEDYEYRLAGVLVHAGVAQGGHYYSFVKDRTSGKWYRFDDEDVTPFDSNLIEQECFGGKMKKETKYPNGHVHTVESEQFANALLVFYEKVKPSDFNDSDAEAKESSSDTAMEEEPKNTAPKPESSNGYEVFLPEVKKSNSTHSWQTFLLTDEFQSFVKELLDVCTNPTQSEDSMDITPNSSPSPATPITEIESWRLNIINTSFSFVFDVLFHLALDSNVRRIWTEKMIQLLSSSPSLSAAFVADLAKRSRTVYENWIRAYSVECSEEASSHAALRIFACAMASTVSQPSEQLLLSNWTQSWASQVADRERLLKKREHIGAMPTRLETARQLEDVANIGGTATGVGIIISFIAELVELSPRMNLRNVNVCFFIRELASLHTRVQANVLRDAMNAAQLLMRLFCLAMREKTPHDYLKQFFPGSSLPMETARMMSKPETNTSNLLHMQHSGMNGNEYQSEKDLLLLEAIGCLFGLPWIKQEPLTFETGSVHRGRANVALTPAAVQALTSIFEESKPSESNGMSKNDVQFYMSRFHHRLNMQKIDNIFERYGVQQPDGGNQLLYLDGFLEFYQSAAQANELEVREHFHVLGFRPNLTRLSDEARFYSDESGEKHHNYPIEAIAIEVARYRTALPLLETTDLLFNLHFAHHIIHSCPNPVAYTLLVAFAFGRDTRRIIHETLKVYQENRQQWDNDWSQMCTTVSTAEIESLYHFPSKLC